MSTNSAIGVVVNGKIRGVYCHWDGYVSGVGKMLLNHYNQAETEKLVSMGSISSLEEEIGFRHSFDHRENGWTTFYHRDRGEDLEVHTFDTAEDFVDYFSNEFAYILGTDGQWYYSTDGEYNWKLVKDSL